MAASLDKSIFYTQSISNDSENKKFKYKLVHPNAVAPIKDNPSDAGYDFHLVELKEYKNGVYMYDTGVEIQLPIGYFGILVGRSRIAKTGFMLANSVGIIDNGYRGTIMAGLIKVGGQGSLTDELKLPNKLVQLILMKQTDFELEKCEELDSTVRGDKGGLGSGQFNTAINNKQ